MSNYLIQFATTLNPNAPSFQWPKYDIKSCQLLLFQDVTIPLELIVLYVVCLLRRIGTRRVFLSVHLSEISETTNLTHMCEGSGT